MASITLRRPDDWHVHFRDGAVLRTVVPFTARRFARAIVMPNLVPPVTTTAMASAYRERVLAAVPPGSGFTPLMTCYLTDGTDPADLVAGHRDGVLTAAKLYPANATTNSSHGVTDIEKIFPVLEAMERAGMPLLVHGEVNDPAVDIFDREAVFIERVLDPTRRRFPALKVVMEHVTTREAVDYVREGGPTIGATITPQHLMINRNAILSGGIRPHYYCLPVAKREHHRLAVRAAATGGDPSFFLGTDTAPHLRHRKEAECGCAGLFNAPAALECYATVFAEENALDKLEAFASLNGPAFYGLPPNEARITLVDEPETPPAEVPVPGEGSLRVFGADETVRWRVQDPA
ncbi:Dihydroorotase [Rhodovulum sp. PH10]|uniref:dihydroorotase n=1 Tax=Rhodovulum sp. PH10 TaxID=1187851 RepID=UPI00027C1EB0|nr:dihydroorotase [Rhodovulum sp. PH10]EJW10362.1 Dihydroorotase [Rhodovulum sp. PH10]